MKPERAGWRRRSPDILGCDEVREQLADAILGTLDQPDLAAVRRHLRGCGSCRAEAAELDKGIALFATAAHEEQPPPELEQRVISALADEWSEAPAIARPGLRPRRWLAVAAAVVALAGALSWAASAQVLSNRFQADAASYRHFLEALGGRNVRVAVLKPGTNMEVDGSAILYDSDRGQSWVLVLARVPGYTGMVRVTLSSSTGRSIELRPMQIDSGGDASTWLVTSSDISSFTTITLSGPGGSSVLASGVAVSED
jgi:hypothetical protein